MKKTMMNVVEIEEKIMKLREISYMSMGSFIRSYELINVESQKIAFKHVYGATLKQFMICIPSYVKEYEKMSIKY